MREGRAFRPAVDARPLYPLLPGLAQLAAASCARPGSWEGFIRPSYGGAEAPPSQLPGEKSRLARVYSHRDQQNARSDQPGNPGRQVYDPVKTFPIDVP